MKETRWWSRLLLVGAIIAVVLLITAPMGYKYGLTALQPSLLSLLVAALAALLIFVVSLVMAVIAWRRGLDRDRTFVVAALVISLVPLVVMGPQINRARSVPPIHDITTDTDNPPLFHAIVGLRKNAPNDLEYGSARYSKAEMAEMQARAYPAVKSLTTALPAPQAVERARDVLASQGMDVVNVDPEAGLVEAVATTFWFGFKDDVVVRVTETDGGSVVDVRSVSRVGQSDVGTNAARIRKFLDAFERSGS